MWILHRQKPTSRRSFADAALSWTQAKQNPDRGWWVWPDFGYGAMNFKFLTWKPNSNYMYIKQLSDVKIVCSLQRKAVTLDIQKAVRHNLRPLELRSLSFPCTAVADIFHRTARRSHWLQIAARHCCAGRVLHQRINSRPESSVHQRTSLIYNSLVLLFSCIMTNKVPKSFWGDMWE